MMPNTDIDYLKELKDYPNWIVWYKKPKKDNPKKFSKPPMHELGYKVNSGGKTYDEAVKDLGKETDNQKAEGLGFQLTPDHPYVCFDLDHIANLEDLPSNEFKKWLVIKEAYTERSPSGKGFRIIFKCEDKDKLDNKPSLVKTLCGDGDLYVSSGYTTITHNHVIGETIPEVLANELEQWVKPKKAEIINIPTDWQGENKVSLLQVKEALDICKLNQSSRVQRAYTNVTGKEYKHYEYWLTILAACHNYAKETNQMTDVIVLAMKWSQTDPTDYEGDEEVISKWDSFTQKENNITYATLQKLANLLKFQWPVEKYTAKGEPTGKPIFQSVKNMQYLLEEYFDLRFYEDVLGKRIYVTGDQDILNKYFMTRESVGLFFGRLGPFSGEELNHIIVEIAQDNKYESINPTTIINVWKSYISGRTKKISLFKEWLETPPEELPEDMQEIGTDLSISNIDGFMSCFDFVPHQNLDLTRILLETFFHAMVMPIYNIENKYAERPFILVLAGKQAARKTSFCDSLFPINLRQNFVLHSLESLKSDKSERDFRNSLAENVIVVSDEVDRIFRKDSDALVKTLVTSSVVEGVGIYEKHAKKDIRRAMIIGTTNELEFQFDPEANRRYAILHVKFIDTDKMEKINKHHLYRSFLLNGKKQWMNGKFPWQVSEETMQIQYQENEKHRSTNRYEDWLNELFDRSVPPHNYRIGNPQLDKKLWKINQIENLLVYEGKGYDKNRKALVNTLKRFCGLYTRTTNKYEAWGKNNCVKINSGVVETNKRKLYVLPPLFNKKLPENYGFTEG